MNKGSTSKDGARGTKNGDDNDESSQPCNKLALNFGFGEES
jgi:hypothetical protein